MIKVNTVRDLIKALETMPADASVGHIWDGTARGQIRYVWLNRSGNVVL